MTFLELKEEADKQGYMLIKKNKAIKMLPCPCGIKANFLHHTHRRWVDTDDAEHAFFIECRRCHKRVYLGMSREELIGEAGQWLYNNAELENMTREKWNEDIKKGENNE